MIIRVIAYKPELKLLQNVPPEAVREECGLTLPPMNSKGDARTESGPLQGANIASPPTMFGVASKALTVHEPICPPTLETSERTVNTLAAPPYPETVSPFSETPSAITFRNASIPTRAPRLCIKSSDPCGSICSSTCAKSFPSLEIPVSFSTAASARSGKKPCVGLYSRINELFW